MREKDIEILLRDEMKKLGGRAYKWISPGNAGVPDRIVVFPDRPPVFVELKSETGNLTALQEAQLALLAKLGQSTYVVRGTAGLTGFFEMYGYPEIAAAIRARSGKEKQNEI